uniref:Chromosome 17 open reading frame 78 n=1 Tax=Apteryx owenii TaxID=8824 RepID=A0A8B9Q200_APTOW
MTTILIFTLLFAHHNLSRKDLRDYECRVENASKISGSMRSLGILLQAPGTAATEGKLSRNQKLITLTCFSLQSPIHVNLYLEKEHGDLRDQAEEKCTLQSLEVITSADRRAATGHSCVLLRDNRKKFQTKFILTGKVFLVGISNCVMTAKLPKLKVFAEGLTVLHVRQDNQTSEEGIPSTNDKDMLIRQRQSLYVKVFIACILLTPAIAYIIAVICEFPCLCPCRGWIKPHVDVQSSRTSLPAASIGKEASHQDSCKERFKVIVIHETHL